jgi:hypothetical protein
VEQGHEGPQLAAVLPSELFGVRLTLAASGRRVCSDVCEGEGLCELGFELGDPGGQGISIGDGGVSFEREVFVFGS